MTNLKKRTLLTEEWLKRAFDDQLNAASILKHRDGTPTAVCFLSHQMAEKYLKALLLHYSGDFPRTHDLNHLLTLVQSHIRSIRSALKQDVLWLGPYYIGARYPGDFLLEAFTWPIAVVAFESALRIKKYVLKKLKVRIDLL